MNYTHTKSYSYSPNYMQMLDRVQADITWLSKRFGPDYLKYGRNRWAYGFVEDVQERRVTYQFKRQEDLVEFMLVRSE